MLAAVAACLPRSGVVVAGVSGGADSLALLHLLARVLPDAQRRLVAVHVNHGLRGAEAERDQRWVLAQCRRLRVLCRMYARDIQAEATRRKLSLEAAGRLARQECFLDAARLFHARVVAVAHHQDDQAETLLLNLLRGASGRGLSGLRPERAFPHPQAPAGLRLIRPLLEFSKQDLEAFLRSEGIRWRQDRSNADPAFARNRIRHRLLPFLERNVQPRVKELLARSAEALARDNEWLDAEVARRLACFPQPVPGQFYMLSRARLRRLPEALGWRLLSEIWDRLGIPGKTTDHLSLLMSARTSDLARREMPGRWSVCAYADCLEFFPPDRCRGDRPRSPIFWDEERKIQKKKHSLRRFSDYGVESVIVAKPNALRSVSKGAEYFYADAAKITGALRLRARRSGDVMQPLGLGGQRKTIKKVMSEMKIPESQREYWPILTQGRTVLWVYRGPVSEAVKVTPATKKVLKIKAFIKSG